MSKFEKQWDLDILQKKLQHKNIKNWVLILDHVVRYERYFLMDASHFVCDQSRQVDVRFVTLNLFIYLNNKTRQGAIQKKLFFHLPLETQLEEAIWLAQQTDFPAWDLMDDKKFPDKILKTFDQRILNPINLEKLSQSMAEIALQVKNASFHSAELFLGSVERTVHFRSGWNFSLKQSRGYIESAFSASGPNASDEYLNTQWSISLDDLDVSHVFLESAERSTKMLAVSKPPSNQYFLLLDAAVLSELCHGLCGYLNASSEYYGLPYKGMKDDLIQNPTADLITLHLDPFVDFGASTTWISEQGALQKPVCLVSKNVVQSVMTDVQMSQFLKRKVSTSIGNIRLQCGTYTYDELCTLKGEVLEILQFSGLFLDPISMTFSSEIRLARLIQKGCITYIKGGCVAGSFFQNFRKVYFSSQQVQVTTFDPYAGQAFFGKTYIGPSHALIANVSVVS